ncbi:MAG: methionyl-tRNA formyltransferase [Desulfitobacteriaceae bacterium]|nr:methionyl-tRNA formyltransferase [Desulfitobacteriaceae bacterium]
MRIIFMGSPDFAVPCLEEMFKSPHEVIAVVTQPDRPKGRGGKIRPTPVKVRAAGEGIPIYQPGKVNSPEFIQQMRELKPDLAIVVAFGQILKPDLLNIPPLGCINVHASLLPKYRGSAPIHWAIINGEKETGVTTMYLDPGMDTGDMILAEKVLIADDDTVGSLHDKLALAGAEILGETVQLIAQGKAPRAPQDHEDATYAPLLKREHEFIDWKKSAREVYDMVRGMNPWPGAYTTFNDKVLKIWESIIDDEDVTGVPGSVVQVVNGKGIKVQCRKGCLWLSKVQPEGSRPMGADAFARGHRVEAGMILGSLAP